MLEATDKAVADILAATQQAVEKLSPDAIHSIGNVAMLSAQTSMTNAWILIGLAFIFLIVTALFGWLAITSDGGFGIISFVVGAIALTILACNIGTLVSPLQKQMARDPKTALTYELMEQFKNRPAAAK